MTNTPGAMMRVMHLPMKIAGGPARENAAIPEAELGANRPGARRGNRHNSATLGPNTLAANKTGPVANKLGAAAMEETGMANGTEDGAVNGANLFDNRIGRTLIDPTSIPVISHSGCSGRRLSSDFCAGKTGGGHSCSRRSKD